MRPLQIWVPWFGSSLAGAKLRDAERAFRAWAGELLVWLLPDLQEPTRWWESKNRVPVLALPAEHLNRVDVFHADKTGQIFGVGYPECFPEGRLDGLLAAWLSAVKDGRVTFEKVPETVTMRMPRVENGQIVMSGGTAVYEEAALTYAPAPPLPFTLLHPDKPIAYTTWPPTELPRPSVSPEEEGGVHYGALSVSQHGGEEVVVARRDPRMRALRLVARFAAPFENLLVGGASTDVLYHQARMVAVARGSHADADGALRRAFDEAGRYVGDGSAPVGHIHFWPALIRGEPAVWGVAEEHGLLERTPAPVVATRDLRAAWASKAWRETLTRCEPVRRVWGVTGLCWALLMEELERGRCFRACERCGRWLAGIASKRFCGRGDDPECFRARRAADKQRELARRARVEANAE
jgi:hypothetical protein